MLLPRLPGGWEGPGVQLPGWCWEVASTLPGKVSCKPPPPAARIPGYPGAGGSLPPAPVSSSSLVPLIRFSSAKCPAVTLRLIHLSSLFCPGFESSVVRGVPQTSTLQSHGVSQSEAVIKICWVTKDQKFTKPQPSLGVCPFGKTATGTRQVSLPLFAGSRLLLCWASGDFHGWL